MHPSLCAYTNPELDLFRTHRANDEISCVFLKSEKIILKLILQSASERFAHFIRTPRGGKRVT